MTTTRRYLPYLLLLLSAAAHASGVLPPALLHLQCDDGEGDVARDSSGNGFHATLHGGVEWVAGKRLESDRASRIEWVDGEGRALRFGEGRWATVPHDDRFNLDVEGTVACWVRLEDDGEGGVGDPESYQQAAFEKGSGWGAGLYSLMPDFENNVLFQTYDHPQACREALRGGYILDTGWRHIAGVWDEEDIRVYEGGAGGR